MRPKPRMYLTKSDRTIDSYEHSPGPSGSRATRTPFTAYVSISIPTSRRYASIIDTLLTPIKLFFFFCFSFFFTFFHFCFLFFTFFLFLFFSFFNFFLFFFFFFFFFLFSFFLRDVTKSTGYSQRTALSSGSGGTPDPSPSRRRTVRTR